VRDRLSAENARTAETRKAIDALNRQISQRTDALQRAAIDSDFIARRGELELNLVRLEDTLGKQEEALKSARSKASRSLADFVALARENAPALVERIVINGPDGKVYEAEWRTEDADREPADRLCGFPERTAESSRPSGTAGRQQSAQALEAELRGLLKGAQSRQESLQDTIDEMNARAAEYVRDLEKLSNSYALQYQKISELEQTELAINTVVDMGVVVAELMLTGGAATVARKTVEIGADQLGKLVAKRLSTSVRRQVAGRIFEQGESAARRKFVTAYSEQVRDALATLTRRGGNVSLEAMRKQAGRLFDETAEKAFRDYFNDKIGANAATILNRRLLNSGAQAGIDAIIAKPKTPEGRALRGIASDLGEVGFDKLVGAVAYKGYEKLAASGKDWKRVGSALASVKPDSLADLIPKKPADIAGFVGTATKAAFSYGIGLEIQAETKKAVELMNSEVVKRMVYEMLFLGRQLTKVTQADVALLAKGLENRIRALEAGRNVNRRLYVLADDLIDDPEADYSMTISFSGPLSAAPSVTIAGVAVRFDAPVGPQGAFEWTGTIPVGDIDGAGDVATIEVSATDMAGHELDASPASIAVPTLEQEGYSFYDPGKDRCYEVLLDLAMSIEASFEGVSVKHTIE
jgi:hypothetical protein